MKTLIPHLNSNFINLSLSKLNEIFKTKSLRVEVFIILIK